jgi:hypothetical protein
MVEDKKTPRHEDTAHRERWFLPAVRSAASASVVQPGNDIHDHGKSQQAQKRDSKTIHKQFLMISCVPALPRGEQ